MCAAIQQRSCRRFHIDFFSLPRGRASSRAAENRATPLSEGEQLKPAGRSIAWKTKPGRRDRKAPSSSRFPERLLSAEKTKTKRSPPFPTLRARVRVDGNDRLLFGSPSGFLVAVCRSSTGHRACPPALRPLFPSERSGSTIEHQRWLRTAPVSFYT